MDEESEIQVEIDKQINSKQFKKINSSREWDNEDEML